MVNFVVKLIHNVIFFEYKNFFLTEKWGKLNEKNG